MADILIRGMEIPSCCLMCPMYTISGCRASKRIFPDWMNVAAVPKDCPLIPLPEGHGRLGDLDALMKNIGDVPYKGAVRRVLMSAPTIVPAEGGTDDGF